MEFVMGLLKKFTAAMVLTAGMATQVLADLTPNLIGQDYLQGEVKISPDGKYLALAIVKDGGRTLAIVDTKTFKGVGGVNFGAFTDVGNFFWANDERIVVEILQRTEWDNTPKYYGELYSVDADGDNGERIFGYRAGEKQVGSVRKKRENIYGWAKVISTMPDDPKHILISSTEMPGGSEIFRDDQKREQVDVTEMNELHSTVHRLNILNGKMSNSYARAPAPNTSFFTDDKGNLTYAIGGAAEDKKELYRYVDGDWQRIKLNEGQMSDVLPLGFDQSFSKVYYLDYLEGGETCLFSYDLVSAEKAKVNEKCNLDADKISITADNATVYAMKTNEENLPYVVFDNNNMEAAFFEQIVETFKGFDIDITSGSEDGSFWVVRATDANDATSFYLYNGEKNQFSRLM